MFTLYSVENFRPPFIIFPKVNACECVLTKERTNIYFLIYINRERESSFHKQNIKLHNYLFPTRLLIIIKDLNSRFFPRTHGFNKQNHHK